MNKTEILNKVTRTFYKTAFKLKKHSPEILMVAGAVGVVTSTVMACKATLKVDEIMEETHDNVDKIHEATETGVTCAGKSYSQEDSKMDLTIVYVQTGAKLAKLYAPAVAVGALSLTAMISSHVILKKRNIALAAAYTALDKGFKEYRGRVIERFGKELDHELRYNLKAVEVEEKVVKEDGTEETVTTTVNAVDPTTLSDYTFIYDDGCDGWTKDPELNKFFLKSQERYANERLQKKGHLFLNEVLDMLGLPRTSTGQVVGWIYDEKHPNGDNFVDFGLLDVANERTRDFLNGYERSVLLNFNVDGPIMDLI